MSETEKVYEPEFIIVQIDFGKEWGSLNLCLQRGVGSISDFADHATKMIRAMILYRYTPTSLRALGLPTNKFKEAETTLPFMKQR